MIEFTEESIKRCCPPDIVDAFYKSIESYLDWQIKSKVALGLLVLPLSEEQAKEERQIAINNAINWVMREYYNPYRIEDGCLLEADAETKMRINDFITEYGLYELENI